MDKLAGTPIKERGIRWAEAYGDKSAYLKTEYEKQVGPGSYFRWEGHDSTTGEDYYCVVTPGYSKKHGFHFFAALRKIPADHGASGKKFKNQAEALSYAYDTWRVPPPKGKPHKPYIDKDLMGKPIVMENVHKAAESEHDGLVKIAFGAASAAKSKKRIFTKRHAYGVKDFAAKARTAATLGTVMGKGAAYNASKHFLYNDPDDQTGPVYNPMTGQYVDDVFTGIATCEQPAANTFDRYMSDEGVPTANRLFEIQDNGEITFEEPLNQNHPNYSVETFGHVSTIHTQVVVGLSQKQAFDNFMAQWGNVKSRIAPAQPIEIVSQKEPAVQEGKEKSLERGNYIFNMKMPVDVFKQFALDLEKKKLGVTEDLNWRDRNAMEIYNYFSKSPDFNELRDPASIEKAKNVPILETAFLSKGQLVAYDESLWPIGIKAKRNNKFDREADDSGSSTSDIKFEFAPGVVERWLALPEVNGNLGQLRSMLASNKIPIQRSDCIDSRTCAPINRHVRSEYPVLDKMDRPTLDKQGNMITETGPLMDAYDHGPDPDKKFVRSFNTESNRDELIPVPADAKPHAVSGQPVIVKNSYYYIPRKRTLPNGSVVDDFHRVSAGETRLFDANSKGKWRNGPAYTLILEPDGETPKKTNVKRIQTMNQDFKGGFFGGTRKIMSGIMFKKALKKNPKTGQYEALGVGKINKEHIDNLFSIQLPNGQVMRVPDGWNDPLNQNNPEIANDPTVQYLRNPANSVTGYTHIKPRMYDPVPLTEAAPTADQPLIQEMMQVKNGLYQPIPDPVTGRPQKITITPDDVVVTKTGGGRNKVKFKKLQTLIKFAQGKHAIDPKIIGLTPNISVEDLQAGFDRVQEINNLVETKGMRPHDFPTHDRLVAEFDKAGNNVPPLVLEQLAAISGDPKDYESRKGTIFYLKQIGSQLPAEDRPTLFVTASKAEQHQKWMETPLDKGGGGKEPGSIYIEKVDNAELTLSAFRARMKTNPNGPAPSLVDPKELQAIPKEQLQPVQNIPSEDEMPTEDVPMPDPAAPIEEPAPEYALAPEQTTGLPPPPSTEEQPVPVESLPWENPMAKTGPSVEGPAPAAPVESLPWESTAPVAVQEPPPAPMPPARPVKPMLPKPPRGPWQTSSAIIEKLTKFANTLDEQGRKADADAVDQIIHLQLNAEK